jgi:ribosome-associated protein
MMHDQDEQYYDDEDENIVSKSEIKREMLALQDLGERLLTLKPQAWEKLNFSSTMLAALQESTRIKSHNAIRRHVRRLGKLLREEDTDQVQQLFDRMDNKHLEDVQQFHRLERWRDRLMEEGDEALNELLDEYPNADRQQLRQLVRVAQKEQLQGKSPAAQRKIFKYLREISGI